MPRRTRFPRTHVCFLALAAVVLGGLAPAPAAGADVAAGLMTTDPASRELRLADALGLLDGPLLPRLPLSRAEAFRLVRPLALELMAGPDADADARGLTPATALRLDRLRLYLSPWDEFWAKDEYPISVWGSLARRQTLGYSEVTRGSNAPHYLDHGYDHRQGLTYELDHYVMVEAVGFALDWYGRLRVDGDALTYRPLVLTARVGWKNLRLILGREPLAWGPEVHGGLLLSSNARPLDQIRIQNDSPFHLFGWRWLGKFGVSSFLGRLDDPNRADHPNPSVWGLRLDWAPTAWLALGASRTVMLDGEGNEFVLTWESFIDLLFGRGENHGDGINDTDQKASVDASVYLWPVFRHVPVLDGGRFYARYAGEDSPQEGPLPSAPGRTWGLELVARGVLARGEYSDVTDDHNLWYWHKIYTDGYTYRGRVMGHPMGGDSKALSFDLEVPVKRWGLAVLGYERQEHGFYAEPGVPPGNVTPPVSHGTQNVYRLGVEKYLGDFPGALGVEVRILDESGDGSRLGPLETWGVTLQWRR